MSVHQTKTALIAALKLPNTPVVALHGPWGSGKTHLWREIESELNGDKNPLYISCMAYGSVAALKSATIATLLSRSSEAAKYGERIFNLAVGVFNARLPEEFRLNASLSDLQVFLPKLKNIVAGNVLLVFDDIERATELSIHELLGFIYFLVDQLGVQVLLVLNKEKLGGRLEAWEQLREKIISIEIAFRMAPDDCVAIGLGGMPKAHLDVFSERVKRLKITNIRALQHMRRVYSALAAEQHLDDNQWLQLIPSIALHVALYLGVIDNTTVVEKMLHRGGVFGYDNKELSEDEKKARELLAYYDIGTPDDFENKILVPYLRTGYLDSKEFATYIAEIELRRQRHEVEGDFNDLMTRYWWDATVSTDELIVMVEKIRSRLDVLDAEHATKLAQLANQLERPSLAEVIVKDWIELHSSWLSTREMPEHYLDFPDQLEHLHPVIQEAYKSQYYQLHPPFSLRESIEYISVNTSWGSRQTRPIDKATQEEIENLIRTADAKLLGRVLRFFTGHVERPGTFQAPAALFVETCRSILKEEPDSRLANIIKRVFADKGVSALLERPDLGGNNKAQKE